MFTALLGPSLILAAAFLWNGAKSPQACGFLASATALLLTARLRRTVTMHLDRDRSLLGLLFIGLCVLSIAVSPCLSRSLFKGIVYLWMAAFFTLQVMRTPSANHWEERWPLYMLWGIAALQAIWVMGQKLGGFPPVGSLPENPNYTLCLWAAAATSLGAWLAFDRTLPRTSRPLGVLLCVLLLAMLVNGGSRGALLGTLVSSLYIVRARWGNRALIGALALIAAIFLVLPIAYWIHRLEWSELAPLGGYRRAIWGLAIRAALERPMLGWGPGNFELAYQRLAFPVLESWARYGKTTEFAHSEPLQILAELGWPSLAVLLPFVLPLFGSRSNPSPGAQAARAGLVAMSVHALVDIPLQVPAMALLFVLLAAQLIRQREKPTPLVPWIRWAWTVLGCLLAVCAGWVGTARSLADAWGWERGVHLLPFDAEAWEALSRQRQGPAQRVALQQWVRWDPENPYARQAAARYFAGGATRETLGLAVRHYLEMTTFAPHNAIGHLELGKALWRLGDPALASEFFDQSTREEPYFLEAWLWKARVAKRLGKRDVARRLLKELPRMRAEALRLFPAPRWRSSYEDMLRAYDPRVVNREKQGSRRKPSLAPGGRGGG